MTAEDSKTVTLLAVLFLLLLAVSTTASTTAQKTTNATNTTTTIPTGTTTTVAVTNFTQLLSQSKEFQRCIQVPSYPQGFLTTPPGYSPPPIGQRPICLPTVDVLYQSPTMLALKSRYEDVIWKAVDLAQKEGYKVAGISTYMTTSLAGTSEATNYVNTLVAMSRG